MSPLSSLESIIKTGKRYSHPSKTVDTARSQGNQKALNIALWVVCRNSLCAVLVIEISSGPR